MIRTWFPGRLAEACPRCHSRPGNKGVLSLRCPRGKGTIKGVGRGQPRAEDSNRGGRGLRDRGFLVIRRAGRRTGVELGEVHTHWAKPGVLAESATCLSIWRHTVATELSCTPRAAVHCICRRGMAKAMARHGDTPRAIAVAAPLLWGGESSAEASCSRSHPCWDEPEPSVSGWQRTGVDPWVFFLVLLLHWDNHTLTVGGEGR